MLYFLSLPQEIILMIISTLACIDFTSLKRTRNTCRLLADLALDELFHTVNLRPDANSQRRIENVLRDRCLRKIPKIIHLYTYNSEAVIQDTAPKGWAELFPRLLHLTHLQNAVLHFDETCGVPRGYYDASPRQTVNFRSETMKMFISLLESFHRPLKELGIENLQGVTQRDPAHILQGSQSLRLSIIVEKQFGIPRFDLPELHKFYNDFPHQWLKPTMTSLRTLALSCETYFGFLPKLDFTGIYFPHLQKLALGNFAFCLDSQLDWIIRHAPTLCELYLDDCAILSQGTIGEKSLNYCAPPVGQLTRDTTAYNGGPPMYVHQYEKRWHHYFEAFRVNLPSLRHFRIGSSGWEMLLNTETDIVTSLMQDRYIEYSDGRYPDELAIRGYEMVVNDPLCDKKDREALRALLAKVGQPVKETKVGDTNVERVSALMHMGIPNILRHCGMVKVNRGC